MKAYDTVCWDFLWEMMKAVKYPDSFADDLFVLSAATSSSMRLVRAVLRRFGMVSGMHPNLNKSTSYFARVCDQKAKELSKILGIPIASLLLSGILADLLSERKIGILRISPEESVAAIKGKVRWPKGRAHTTTIQVVKGLPNYLDEGKDSVVWFGTDRHLNSKVWKCLRERPENINKKSAVEKLECYTG
ncbi:hypothetical protein LIER_14377 [Lithospermum erythrorhizon]|uniref:Reverse transcriptase domain-containing protein n=1 Tax=Lithospermum erythrorhizon TaxID=34254 RepID=A0AAV3PZ32_LITER